MSHVLIARNADLRRLDEEGFTVRIVDDAYLLIENVPYVTALRDVQDGILGMELTLSGDCTVPPTTHVAYWAGEFPYEASGHKLVALLHENTEKYLISELIPPAYQLSAKPAGGYSNYHHKVVTYVEIISREARCISPDSTAQKWKVAANSEDSDSVFNFADTASARQNTTDLARMLKNERIAIIGVGGTGSYVLDYVAKTWAHEIHLFDNDRFLQHNAFRSPGPVSLKELQGGPFKSEYHAERYSRMRKGVFAHNVCIDESNVHLLEGFDTVFLCMDGHPIKTQILDTCVSHDILLIDVGMGLYRVNDKIAGVIRTTAFSSEHRMHVEHCIDLAGSEGPGEYERNAQLAELNALNASLAVIKWKKARGFYNDLTHELNCEYVIDGNKLVNSYFVDGQS